MGVFELNSAIADFVSAAYLCLCSCAQVYKVCLLKPEHINNYYFIITIAFSLHAGIGLGSSHCALDGVPFKIGMAFRPPPKVAAPKISFFLQMRLLKIFLKYYKAPKPFSLHVNTTTLHLISTEESIPTVTIC